MYTDYLLKFADQAEADAVLFDGDGEERRAKYTAVDVIGTIWKPTGKMLTTDEGDMPQMAPVPGYHANVRHTAEAPELDAFVVQVDNPVRIWA